MVGAGFTTLVDYFQAYGVLDFLLPFILVFTIIFAVMQKTNILGQDAKKFNVIIALVLGLLFVVPHMLGTYPLGYDPVQVLNESLPSISLVAVAAIMLLLMLGLFGAGFTENARPIIGVASIAFILYIFGSSLGLWFGPYDVFSWWSSELTELIIIILIFGLVVWFITGGSDSVSAKDSAKAIWSGVKSLFGKAGE